MEQKYKIYYIFPVIVPQNQQTVMVGWTNKSSIGRESSEKTHKKKDEFC